MKTTLRGSGGPPGPCGQVTQMEGMREHSPEMRAAAKHGAAAWPPAPRRFDSASRYLDSATVFGVKPGLVRDVVPDAGGPGVLVEHNIVLRRL